ncbi:MAG: shikimate kinase [Prolixibacteraceae bacterium]|nr:shikimate kinase [Prolixibacteraceae bacterium]
MRIFLTGYMGCGKSTIGRKVAALMGMNFIDLDKYIEERNFKSVPDIFAQEGEATFREKERQALQEVAQFEDIIIGTGGGAPCFFENMKKMNETGITIYLAPDNETLACRLLKSKTERPLIAGKSKEELIAFIEVALAKRAPFYEQSKIVIRGINDIQPADVVSLIQEYLNKSA